MNSLEFIKQHVTEWPDDKATRIMLCTAGGVVLNNSTSITPIHFIDLSEHFAPDYYDGKVWTREEFESVGTFEQPDVHWDNAPEWATSFGTVGIDRDPIWYNRLHYIYVDGATIYTFNSGANFNANDVTHIMDRPITTPSFDNVTHNKYEREITDRQGNSATVDVYDVIIAFGVTCPATQDAIKKLLCTGDLSEARDSITRAIELLR